MSESVLMREIMKAATPYARLFRNNTGRLPLGDGKWLNYGLCVGSSDLIGWSENGHFVAVEVKGPKGKLTKEQSNFIDEVNKAGGIGIVAYSVEDVINELCRRCI